MNLSVFNTQNLYDATHELFARLRIKLNSKTAMSLPAKTLLADNYLASFEKQDFPEIQELYFAGIVDDSIFEADAFNNGYTIDDANDIDKNTKNYPGFMIFALLLDKHPTRTQIANLSRAFNRKWNVPVALLIQYGRLISLALPERFKYLQNWRQGEKVGKVIILRDINTDRPHTGHLRILQDLSKHNATNFNELHEKWLKVLNIKTLNDEFYERLVAKVNKSSGAMIEKGWYFKCFEDIRIDLSKASLILNKKIEDELKPQAVIRVIIRLMFIWFMKEKELINPDFFTRDFMNDFLKRENTYYNAVLQNLFFAVLNAKISERRFRKQNKNSYFDTEENEYGMFQLFRYESFFKQGKAEEFKQLTDTIPFVNGGLFTCHDQKIKHNQSENYIIDGFSDNPNHRTVISDSVIFELIDLFNDYVFTIEESTPMEQDIALDPELLGTIFENLIGFYNPETKENARKQTGSFYTPREIVDYMCSESLKESLKTRFPNLHTQIDRLIDRNEDYLNFPEKNKLLAAITDLKILDPACGSGAFPMGMFNLMVRTVEKLQEHKTTYKNKLDIIENCIYGIDIQNIAVEISKLRFFISLLVDYESPANIADFEVLPNLETKFVVANTLIGIDLGHSTDIFESQIIKEFQELTEIFLPFTTAKTPKEKEKINNDFNRKKEAIINNPNFEFGKDAKEKIRAWNPFNVCYCAPFFDSQIMFGITDGFDVVIGNPPYAQVPKGLFSKEQFPYSEGKDKGKQNLYKVFVEASYNLTNDKSGLVCLIVQSSLMCDLSSIFTRELLLRKTHVMQLIEFPKKSTDPSAQVFESVLQGTCVVLFKKIKLEDKHTIHLSINNNTRSINTPDFAIIPQSEFTELEAIGYPFPLFRRGEFDIWRKMRVKGQPLKSLITEVRQGDINLTNNSNAFSTSQTEVKLFRGRHVQRYHLKTEVEEYIKEGFFVQKANENKENTIIVCQEITGTVDPRRLIFTMVKDLPFHFVFGHTVQKFTLKNDEYSKVVLGILNSQLMDWFFRKTSTNNHIGGYEIEQLPMPDFNTNLENCTEITILVNQILSTKKENPAEDTSEFERKIDKLVYGLYGLTDEEIKIIEGGVK